MPKFIQEQKYPFIVLIISLVVTVITGYGAFFVLPKNVAGVSSFPLRVNEKPVKEESQKAISQVITDQYITSEKAQTLSTTKNEHQIQIEQKEIGQNAQEKANTISTTLTVGGNTFGLALPEGSSVYDMMNMAREQFEFQFSGKEYAGLGFFIEEINGIKNDHNNSGKYWIYYINGKKADVGISQYRVQSGDTIEWKYEEYQ